MRLRPASPADVAAVAGLERLVFGAGAWSLDAVTGELAACDRRAVVAQEEGEVVGYAITMLAGATVDLQRIAVRPDRQRRGLARALLRAAIRRAVEDGANSVLLEVAAGNEAALGLYRREGFEEIHRRRRYYPDGSDALVMSRPLRRTLVAGSENGGHGSV